jgi:hypothetical protein
VNSRASSSNSRRIKIPTLDGTTIEDFLPYIGAKVSKVKESREPKPFKSGSKINTVKGVIMHPILNIPAFTFEEDESYVECRRCGVVD